MITFSIMNNLNAFKLNLAGNHELLECIRVEFSWQKYVTDLYSIICIYVQEFD